MMRPAAALLMCLLPVTGCTPSLRGPDVQTGSDAYRLVPAPPPHEADGGYILGPRDRIDVTVHYEADISPKGVAVDADGMVALPLIGRVQAAGLTSTQLADVLRDRYLRYYIDPQVTVSVAQILSREINVQGDVQRPGIYPIRGMTTLLDAIALARGESETASLSQVVVLRGIDDQRQAALFDLNRIRRGEDPDPVLRARDVIVVGHSNVKQLRRDVLRAAPLLNIFTLF